MVNQVILIGRLGAKPELKQTTNGANVSQFSVATSKKFKTKDGSQKEDTQWHSIVVWNKLAEIACEHLGKGSLVYLEGELQTRSWDDQKTGEKKYKTEIVCNKLQFLSDKKQEKDDEGMFDP